MTATAIVFSCLFYLAALLLMTRRPLVAPCCSFMGLLILSFAKTSDGYPLLPINTTLIIGWLCMTVFVTIITFMQPSAIIKSTKGTGYMAAGSIVGMAIGLLGFTFSSIPNVLYAIMIVATAAGTFFGYIIFVNTPSAKAVSFGSGQFFTYILAKGFPIAITTMQMGVVLVLLIAMHNYSLLS